MPALTLTFVDDSEADHYLIQHAAQALPSPVRTQHFLHADHFLISLDRGELTQDALITDLNMPGPSGFDLIGALLDRPAWRHLPVLPPPSTAATPLAWTWPATSSRASRTRRRSSSCTTWSP